MSKQTTFKTPHDVELNNGQHFTTEAHTVCPNRLFDGIDRLYFETYDTAVPEHGTKYHEWNMTTRFLYAWTIPMEHVLNISKCEEPKHGSDEVAKLGRFIFSNLK